MKATEKTIAKNELNNALKEEYKSFSMLCKVLTAKKKHSSNERFFKSIRFKI